MSRSLFGMTVIESSDLPRNVVLLADGRTFYAWNTDTGEVRSMQYPTFTMTFVPFAIPEGEDGGTPRSRGGGETR